MALTWPAKPAGGVLELSWIVPVAGGDGIYSVTLTVASGDATIDAYDFDGDTVSAFVSGGTANTVTAITATVETVYGETIAETIYLPIISTAVQGTTARDVCAYALRKVSGIGVEPDADELEDALERLNDLLAMWKRAGADLSIPLPAAASDVLYIDDAFMLALKANLLLRVFDLYGEQPTPMQDEDAKRSLQAVKQALLPDARGTAVYF